MNNELKMFIGNEEVVSNNNFTINEEMLSASSTILNNCYPKSWELTKDYASNFYYPEDYSKFVIGWGGFEHGTTEYSILEASGEQPTYETNVEKDWNKLIMEGNTYQYTEPDRYGKNMLCIGSVSSATGLTITKENNSAIRINGTATSNVVLTLQLSYGQTMSNLPYNLSIRISPTLTNSIAVNIPQSVGFRNITISQGTAIIGRSSSSENNRKYTALEIAISSGTNFSNVLMSFQLEQNNSYTAFEPFWIIPGTPSPTRPSDIDSVGYTNLVSITQESGTYNELTFTKINPNTFRIQGTTGQYARSVALTNIFPKINEGENYTWSAEVIDGTFVGNLPIAIYNEDDTITYNYFVLSANKLKDTKQVIANHGIQSIHYYIQANQSVDMTLRIMFEKGEVAHTPIWKDEYGIDIKTIGTNLFDYEKARIIENTYTTQYRLFKIDNLKPNTQYSMYNYDITSGTPNTYIYLWNTDQYSTSGKAYISSPIGYNNKATLTTKETGEIYLAIYDTTTTTWGNYITLFEKAMLTEGTQEYDYEPYDETNYTYTMFEPLRAIGDIKDTLKIENGVMTITRNIGSIILNGTEEWYVGGSVYYTSVFVDTIAPTPATAEILGYSKYFQITGFNYGTDNNLYFHSNKNLQVRKTNYPTLSDWTNWLSTHNTEVQYILAEPKITTSYPVRIAHSNKGINSVILDTGIVNTSIDIYYYYKNFDVLFSGIVKNTGDISLNPRDPHYCSLQILDYKTFLSESDTLDFVISNKTIAEAIQMVVEAINGYGFILGNINISQANDIIGAYSTLNQTAYDVFQYLANISGSRWRARYVDSTTMAIDFYDPDLLPQANDILYTKEYWEENEIIDITFNYGTRDYRNKQIVLSDEVFADIDYTESLYADGYQNTYLLEENIAVVKSVEVNGVAKEVITKDEKDNGVDGDFWYTPGKNTLESNKVLSVNNKIEVVYTPLIKGRQIIYNSDEVQRIANNTDTIGVIARYETRNDVLSSIELSQIGNSYIEYKGKPEIILTIKTKEKDLFNIGEVAYFNAPITELQQNYMVKSKNINYIIINNHPTLFYEYQLTSSYNSEKAINYFDNQRNKAQGNIQLGDTITRNIDIENTAIITWQNLTITEVNSEDINNNVLNV